MPIGLVSPSSLSTLSKLLFLERPWSLLFCFFRHKSYHTITGFQACDTYFPRQIALVVVLYTHNGYLLQGVLRGMTYLIGSALQKEWDSSSRISGCFLNHAIYMFWLKVPKNNLGTHIGGFLTESHNCGICNL